MINKIYKVGILGGGISGLSCANHLNKNGITDFVLVTKELGGRICSSSDHQVNYGAYYVRSDYKHMLPFVTLKRKIKLRDLSVITDQGRVRIKQIIRENFWSLIKLLPALIKFRIKFKKFRKESEYKSQKQLIESDPELKKLYKQSSEEFLRDRGLGSIYQLAGAIVRSNTFAMLKNVSAFLFLDLSLGLFYNNYEYEFKLNELIADYTNRIVLSEVASVQRGKDFWIIKSEAREIWCKNLVSALPVNVTNDLLNLNLKINKFASAYSLHIRGTLRPQYQASIFSVFSEGDEPAILRQSDHSYLLYSSKDDVDLSKYFMDYEVLTKKYWNPAIFSGSDLIELKQQEDLFIIGDSNLPGLEDSFITGICAANLIINQ